MASNLEQWEKENIRKSRSLRFSVVKKELLDQAKKEGKEIAIRKWIALVENKIGDIVDFLLEDDGKQEKPRTIRI